MVIARSIFSFTFLEVGGSVFLESDRKSVV